MQTLSFGQFQRRESGQPRIIGDQHQWPLLTGHFRRQQRANRPARPGDMALAISHARSQVNQRNGVVLQCISQRQRRDRWQRLVSGNFDSGQRQTAAHAALQDIRFMPQLPQPTGNDRCPHAITVEQHQPRLTHADIQIGGLNQLPARCVLRTRQTARGKLLGGAHVAQKQAAPGLLGPLLDLRRLNGLHTGPLRQLRSRESLRPATRRATPPRHNVGCCHAPAENLPDTNPVFRFPARRSGSSTPD